jgi:hypothetical protein
VIPAFATFPAFAMAVALAASPAPPSAALHCWGTGAPSLREAAGNAAVARAGAGRAARRDALRRCMAALELAPLAAGGTVASALAADPSRRERVERAVRRLIRRGAVRLFADGGVRIEVELPFRGRLEDLAVAGGGP